MNNILQKLGLKDGESIDHPWINKALDKAKGKGHQSKSLKITSFKIS